MDCQQPQVDLGTYHQAPILYLLRNACAPVLANIVVKYFKNTEAIRKLNVDQCNPINPDSKQSNQQQSIDIENITIFEFLKKINNRGKKEEDKRRKASSLVDDQQSDTISRTLHLNNLRESEDSLSEFKASDLIDETHFPELIEVFSKFDVTFLLNLLTNDILHYHVPDKLFKAICEVKRIRNCTYHSGRKVNCKEFHDVFHCLCSTLEVLYCSLGWEISELEAIIQEAKHQHESRYNILAPEILEAIHKEISSEEMANVKCRSPQSYVIPTLMDTRGEMAVIENFELYLGQDARPVLLCGPSGSGKSTILQTLTQKFCVESHNLPYKVVINLDSSNRVSNQVDYRKAVSKKLCNSCPKTVEKYGIDILLGVIKMSSDAILFLVNWNIGSLENARGTMVGGKWVFCSHVSHIESSPHCHIVRVMPLNDTLVKQMLRGLIVDVNQYQQVVRLYDECEYKGLIDSPDMVAIFSEIRTKTPCYQMLQSYLHRKLGNALVSTDDCRALGKIAFYSILKNKKLYFNKVLCDISNEVKTVFLVPWKNDSFLFRYRIIEDLLAAKYVITKPEEACKEWVKQVPLFKRVFRFVCTEWCENGEIRKNWGFLKPYLAKYFDIQSSGKREGKAVSAKAFGNRETADDILNVDAESSKEDSFSKWTYLISLMEYCNFQCDAIKLVCELLSQKTAWIFKCKYLDEEKVNKLHVILGEIQLQRPTVIKIESACVVVTLNKIWQMLSTLPGLYNNDENKATVQITIRHRELIPVSFSSHLPSLPMHIATLNEPLYITKYKGPFMCTNTPEFFKCLCMRKLEVLDVCVYDVATLAEVLSCEGLENLKAVVVKVDLRLSERASVNFQKLRLPLLPNIASLTLTIKYFDGLQKLLTQFENPSRLKSIIIHGMRIQENFKLDFASFKNLESLIIRFNPHTAQHSKIEAMETDLVCSNQQNEQLMETNQACKDNIQLMKSDLSCRAQDLPLNSWTFQLSVNLKLPQSLERLMLRNTAFCNDSNIWQMIHLWKNNNIQRLILLDSNLSVKGVRDTLKSHIPEGDDDDDLVDNLGQKMKRHCEVSRIDATNVRESLTKRLRLNKEDREQRRKCKPPGKELIITSQCDLCRQCREFPCCCQRMDGEDHRDSLQDVVHLIEDAYEDAHQCDIISLSYYSEIITVRKDVCGDLRVHCPLTSVDDATIANLDKGDKWLKSFFHSLTLAQCINLDLTKLSHTGAQTAITKIKELKLHYCRLPDVEPFSFSVSSSWHPKSLDEVKNSTFIHFLIHETCLVQFKFCCCCEKRCHYIRKARDGKIYLNDECLKL